MIVPPLKGLNKCVSMITPGLVPWALKKCRPYRAFDVSTMILLSVLFYDFFAWVGVALEGLIYVIIPNQLLGYFHGLALACS